MANEKIILRKIVISNKESNEKFDKKFEKLAKSEPTINTEIIGNLYDNLFYNIPKQGKNSHQSIIKQSYDYRKASNIQRLETKINKRTETLEILNEQLITLETGDINEHEIYEDGAFLMAGENGSPYQTTEGVISQRWVMQEGRKRLITEELYSTIRR